LEGFGTLLLVGMGSQGDCRSHGPLFVEIGEVCDLLNDHVSLDGLAKFACSMLIVVQLDAVRSVLLLS